MELSHDGEGNFAPGLYVVDVARGTTTRLVGRDSLGWSGAWWPQWSPKNDERLLLWANGVIGILDTRDGSWQQITWGQRDENCPFWSPSGDSVFYTRTRKNFEPVTVMGLYVHDLVHGVLHRFTAADSLVTGPVGRAAFSPDGRWIAYVDGVEGDDGTPNLHLEIFAVRSDGSERRRLTRLEGQANNPVWMDVDEIAFDFVPTECLVSSNPVIHTWSVRIDGAGLHRWNHDFVDSRVQYSWTPAVDPRLRRAAVVQLDERLGVGNLFVVPIPPNGHRERVLRSR